MAELKRLFVGSKMDQDSDERFVASGDYTHSVNTEVISTEGGDAGVVRNKVGNRLKANRSYNPSTFVYTEWNEGSGDTFPFGFSLNNAKTVGIYKHSPTETIYSLIKSGIYDIITEYNASTKLLSPIIVSTDGTLGFDQNTQITGISFLEGVLGWVQEDVEPKSIVVEDFKAGSTDFITHTQYQGRDFILSDVTMKRLDPLVAPTMELSRSTREGIIAATTQANFTIAQTFDNSLSLTKTVGSTIIFSIDGNQGTAYIIGDKIKLTRTAPSEDASEGSYEINAVITSATVNGSSIRATIISSTEEVEDSLVLWEVDLFDSKPLFELVFPRFSYRWKWDDGQYSTYAPFTKVAFLPDSFLYNSQKGYNTGMTNNVRKVTLSSFGTIPAGVDEVEVLYKESGSNAVYVVDSIESKDFYKDFDVTDELIYKLVSSVQLLRPWDAVPKSAKALEVVANRFVLGNYKKQYDVPDPLKFEAATVLSAQVADTNEPEESIKSLRTYQAGVIYKDGLGRETPIFSDKSGVVTTGLDDSTTNNKLQFQLKGAPPEWATHFKYFIKDTANIYYNLAADRLYETEDKLATWVSFPSSERNKVTLDTYLIAKKIHDGDKPVTDPDNKFKIIDIQNEAPDEIKEKKEELVSSNILFDSNFGDGRKQTVKNVGSTPTSGSKVFLIAADQPDPDLGMTSILQDELDVGNFIRFENGTSVSKYYKISSVLYNRKENDTYYGFGMRSNIHAKVYVTEPFGDDVNFIYEDQADPNSLIKNDAVIKLSVNKQQLLANQEQFTGRFFVKLPSNAVLNNVFSADEEFVTLNATNLQPGGYVNDTWFKLFGGGHYPRLDYSTTASSGGLNLGSKMPGYANDNSDLPIWDIVFEKRKNKKPIDNELVAAVQTVGTRLRFSNHSTVYTIKQAKKYSADYDRPKSGDYERYLVLLDKRLQKTVHPTVLGEIITMEIVGLEDVSAFTSSNPAIFETEPLEGIDLNLYHEASDAYPVAEYNDLKTLDYFNCFTFGNGVESNRIRDDFNAVIIDKGPKVSTVLDEPYGEEHTPNGLIWSGIFNSNSGTNNLNQFLLAEKTTKEVSPIYGSIQFLHARDTDMVICCEDKILQALADKDALYNADGSSNITASNAVIGNVRAFVGEFGISTDPGSFASYGFRAYFTDRNRGVVLRLSRDGITPIVDGYENELEGQLSVASDIFGSFDSETGKYNLTLGGRTHQFSEDAGGWAGTWEVNPDMGVTLNNKYYTSKGGYLWSHDDDTNRNSWYGNAAVKSSITFVFNDDPSSMKKFKTLSYEGDDGWIASEIETNLQSGRVIAWEEREGKFYNYIKGLETTWDNDTQSGSLDSKEFSVQGIGNLVSISGDTTKTEFTIDIFDDPSDH